MAGVLLAPRDDEEAALLELHVLAGVAVGLARDGQVAAEDRAVVGVLEDDLLARVAQHLLVLGGLVVVHRNPVRVVSVGVLCIQGEGTVS